ncbi:uncharacterized protein MYCFIDRAFT_207008 [Pseudocercospora fijiensis CIRAD86]|uniref:Uncharacterized protein n=1 Tax=Pseudocercospora fijiensis (strain CIRAD86) TaxID=383855 RepID=M3BCH2_PSEFD|nr:uncharacterized protein MYCFIDRAFT_207008 [Pseudocercospora fijiensis CIRAD86]EME86977.1 hypothetical protein MYCFIDRAFT_207008 [Pseudocercospora fijiensis CIRAD86]
MFENHSSLTRQMDVIPFPVQYFRCQKEGLGAQGSFTCRATRTSRSLVLFTAFPRRYSPLSTLPRAKFTLTEPAAVIRFCFFCSGLTMMDHHSRGCYVFNTRDGRPPPDCRKARGLFNRVYKTDNLKRPASAVDIKRTTSC